MPMISTVQTDISGEKIIIKSLASISFTIQKKKNISKLLYSLQLHIFWLFLFCLAFTLVTSDSSYRNILPTLI